MKQAIAIFYCEVRWALFQLWENSHIASRKFALRIGAGVEAPSLVSEELFEEERLLRRLLRGAPWWTLGHSRLGLCAVEQAIAAVGKKDPRLLQTIRLSATAVDTLLKGDQRPRRAFAESTYMRAMISFFGAKYEEAKPQFLELATESLSSQLTLSIHYRSLEYGSACALACGDKVTAAELLERIPAAHRTAEMESALKYAAFPSEQ